MLLCRKLAKGYKKAEECLAEKPIVAYGTLLVIYLLFSYVTVGDLIGWSGERFARMSLLFILLFAVSISWKIFLTYLVLKLIKVSSNLRFLSNKIVFITLLRSIVAMLFYVIIENPRDSVIYDVVNVVLDFCYYIYLIYNVKAEYNLSGKKTMLFTAIYLLCHLMMDIVSQLIK